MFIQPSLTSNDVDVLLPKGEYISIGNTGNEPTTVLLQAVVPTAQAWNYSQLGTLSTAPRPSARTRKTARFASRTAMPPWNTTLALSQSCVASLL